MIRALREVVAFHVDRPSRSSRSTLKHCVSGVVGGWRVGKLYVAT